MISGHCHRHSQLGDKVPWRLAVGLLVCHVGKALTMDDIIELYKLVKYVQPTPSNLSELLT